jgi:hypothetical protein
MKSFGVLCLLCLFLFGTIPSTLAEPPREARCDQRGTILAYLSKRFAEAPIAMGVAENGGLIEVLSSNDGMTFTIIVTRPDGQTCMVAAGGDWQRLTAKTIPET